jgi:hypothetical protein
LTTTFSPVDGHPVTDAAGVLLAVGSGDGAAGDEDGAELGDGCGLTEEDVCPPEARGADPHAAASAAVHSNSAVVTPSRAAESVMA